MRVNNPNEVNFPILIDSCGELKSLEKKLNTLGYERFNTNYLDDFYYPVIIRCLSKLDKLYIIC